MKSNTIWVLVAGLAVGFLVGRELPRAGSGGGGSADKGAETQKAAAGGPTAIPAGWLTETELKAADKMAGLTPAQRYTVLKVMNEKPCDCGCPHGTTAACLKDDPNCPRAPVIFNKAIEMAKGGSTAEQILAAVKKADAPSGGGAQPSAYQKVELAKWTPIKGNKNAKVTMVIFSDFQCPFCSRVEPTIAAMEKKYGKDLRLAWRNQPLPFHDKAKPAAEAAMAAGAQGKFWEMHDLLFKNQQNLDRATFEKHAQELGLNMAKFKADLDSEKYKTEIEEDSKAGTGYGASGTPTMFINGRQLVGAQPETAFIAAIDEEMKRADELLKKGTPADKLYEKLLETLPAAAPAPAAAEAPTPTTKVDVPIGDSPAKGPKSAPVTVVIFSDFQCPFCSRVEPTLAQLEKDYAGKIRFVWKNQPLPFHDKAKPAAEAAMAAGAQGKFWEMHDKLFANQQSLDRATFEKHAQELGLNMDKFKSDLDTHKFEEQIKKDSEEGNKVGANGTPTFFINGYQLVGAQPVDAFKKLIDEQLKKKG